MFTKQRLLYQWRLMIGQQLKIPINHLQCSADSNLLFLPSQVLENILHLLLKGSLAHANGSFLNKLSEKL